MNRLRVVVAHFFAQGPDEGVESALVLALRKGGDEMPLEQLPHAGIGEHRLEPVAHVDARDPRLREDEYDEPRVVFRRADLPVRGGLNRPRRKVPFRRLAVDIDNDLRALVIEQCPGPLAGKLGRHDTDAVDEGLCGLRERRRRRGLARHGEDQKQNDRHESRKRPPDDPYHPRRHELRRGSLRRRLGSGLGRGHRFPLALRVVAAGYVTAIEPWLLRVRPEVAPAWFPHNVRRWRLSPKKAKAPEGLPSEALVGCGGARNGL